jgi:hypothetical protein
MLGLDARIDPYPCFLVFSSFIAYLFLHFAMLILSWSWTLADWNFFFLGLYVSAEGLPIQGPIITSEWIHDDGAANSYHKTYASCQWSDSMACAGAPVRCVISDVIELIIQLHQPCRDALTLLQAGILCNAQQLMYWLLVIWNYTLVEDLVSFRSRGMIFRPDLVCVSCVYPCLYFYFLNPYIIDLMCVNDWVLSTHGPWYYGSVMYMTITHKSMHKWKLDYVLGIISSPLI